MMESKIIDIASAAEEIVEVLSRHKITYSGIECVFERAKDIAHSNTINQPLKCSTNSSPS